MDDSVLNPSAAPARPGDEPGGLARELLHAARGLGDDPDAVARVADLGGRLHHLEPTSLSGDAARTAFWLNLYNAGVRQAMHAEQLRGNLLLKLGLFNRTAYRVGALRCSLNVIEHGILRANRKPPAALFRVAKDSDPRLRAAPSRVDARIHFALNCGARSCPPIRSYDPAKLDALLAFATRAYFDSEAKLDRARAELTLPKLCKYYKADFGDERAAAEFAAKHMSDEDAAWIRENARRLSVRYGDYDWTIER